MQERITKNNNLDINFIKKMMLGYETFDEYHSFLGKNLKDVSEENKLENVINENSDEVNEEINMGKFRIFF